MTEDPNREESERRREERKLSCIPASLRIDDDDADVALIRNLSRTGALLLTRVAFVIGDTVILSVHLTDSDEGVPVRGAVVRAAPRSHTRKDPWHYELGVEFAEPLDAYAEQIEKLAERQAEFGPHKRASKPPSP